MDSQEANLLSENHLFLLDIFFLNAEFRFVMHLSNRYAIMRKLAFLRSVVWQIYRDKVLISLTATLVFGLCIYLLNKLFYPSRIWDELIWVQGIDVWFCEFTDMKKLIRQPVNTFTNFAYFVTGMFYLSKGLEDNRKSRAYNLITANPYYSITLGIIYFYTFACSTFFHASLVDLASDLDFSAVYSICLFPLMYFMHRVVLHLQNKPSKLKHRKESTTLIVSFSSFYLILTFIVGLDYAHELVLIIVALVVIAGTWLESKDPGKTNKSYLALTTFSIVLAIMFFAFDTRKILCIPDSVIQPHSLWHLLNATSVFYFYLYIRSENYDPAFDRERIRIHKSVFG